MAKSWDDISPRTGGDRDKFQLDNFFKLVDKKRMDCKGRNAQYHSFRFHGGVVSFEQAWIPLYKDGRPVLGKQTGKPVKIPKVLPSYDSDSEGYRADVADPYVPLITRMNQVLDKEEKVRIERTYLTNVIWRAMQRGRPRDIIHPTPEEQQTGFITPESETWTANYVFPMSPSLADRVKNLKSLNTHMVKGRETAFSVTHAQAGCDVGIKFDSTLAPALMWDAQKGNHTRMSPEELAMLTWDLDVITRYVVEIDLDAAKSDADRFAQGFFHNERRGGSGRSLGRTLQNDDLPPDLGAGPAPARGRGRAAAPPPDDFADDGYGGADAGFAGANDFGGGDQGFGGDDQGFGDTGDLDGGFDAPATVQTRRPSGGRGASAPVDDFGADDGFGSADQGFGDDQGFDGGADAGFAGVDDFADVGGGSDFGDDGFDAPAAPAERMPARGRAPANQAGQQRRAAPLEVDAGDLGELGGLDEDDGGFGGADFGSNDFGGDDVPQAPVRRGPAPAQGRGPAPAQGRGPAPQQNRGPAPQGRGPAPGAGRPQNSNGQQQRPGAGAQQRAPAPAQQRPAPNGQQQRSAAPAPGRGPVRQGAPAGGAYGYGGGYGTAPQAPRGPSQQSRPTQPSPRGYNPRDPRYGR